MLGETIIHEDKISFFLSSMSIYVFKLQGRPPKSDSWEWLGSFLWNLVWKNIISLFL